MVDFPPFFYFLIEVKTIIVSTQENHGIIKVVRKKGGDLQKANNPTGKRRILCLKKVVFQFGVL